MITKTRNQRKNNGKIMSITDIDVSTLERFSRKQDSLGKLSPPKVNSGEVWRMLI